MQFQRRRAPLRHRRPYGRRDATRSLLVFAAAPRPRRAGRRRRGGGRCRATVARPFAYGPNPFRAGWHRGVDLAARPGATVRAACPGRVATARPGLVTLRCGPWRVTHLPLAPRRGPSRRGACARGRRVLGTLGRRAARGHAGLHLGVRRAGERFGYVDPLPFLGGAPPRPVAPRRCRAPAAARAAAPPRARAAAARRRCRAGAGAARRRPGAARRPAPAPARRRRAPVRRRFESSCPPGRGCSRLGPPGPGSRCCCSARPGAGCGSGCGGVARGSGRRYRQRHDRRAADRVRPRRVRGGPARADVAAGDPLDAAQRHRRRPGHRGRDRGRRHAVRGRRGGGRGRDPVVRAGAARGGHRRRGRADLPRRAHAVERVPDPARRRDRRGAGHAEARVRRRARRDRVEPADDRVVGGGLRRGLDRPARPRAPRSSRCSPAWASGASRGWRS